MVLKRWTGGARSTIRRRGHMVNRDYLLRPPYGAVFFAPEGWGDQSHYRFVEPAGQHEFVLDARPWKAPEAVTQLEATRATLAAANPTPITRYPHSVFEIHGFQLDLDGDDTRPDFRMFTLVAQDQVWVLRLVGPMSTRELEEWLATFTLPSRIEASPARYGWRLGSLSKPAPDGNHHGTSATRPLVQS